MPGELQKNCVLIVDEREANRVHNKGYPGIPQSGGSLKLGLLEAGFLMEEKDFEITGMDSVVDLFQYAGDYFRDFEVQYLVYRELKLRGFFVRIPDSQFADEFSMDLSDSPNNEKGPGHEPFRLLPRGAKPSTPASIHVLPISERTEFNMVSLLDFFRTAETKGVEAIAGVVDEDGDVTFYSLRSTSPSGDCNDQLGSVIDGKLGRNRVLVELDTEAKKVHQIGFYGRVLGTTLHLSLLEGRYLLEKGNLEIRGLSVDDLQRNAAEMQSDFSLRYPVYKLLRDAGVRVKTGFKYGTHFRAYSQDPDKSHADFLVHVYQDKAKVDWQEISRGVRVAHGVKKRILLTSPQLFENKEFLELAWVRP